MLGEGLRKSTVSLQPVLDNGQLEAVRELFREYARSLSVDLCFQNFEEELAQLRADRQIGESDELAQLPGEYASPRGALYTVCVDGELAGCCAMRPLDAVDYSNACEMKRLYVRPAYRRLRLGRMLAEAILDAARMADYDCILLDTLDDMESARALYEELGFEEIPPYYYNPIAGAHYLKAQL